MAVIVTPSPDIDEAMLDEFSGSPQETFTESGFEATQQFIVPWAQRLVIGQKFRGQMTSDLLGNVSFVAPKLYGANPPGLQAACSNVDVKPFIPEIPGVGVTCEAPLMKYDYALLTVKFSTKTKSPSSPEDITYIEEGVEPFTEYITLPGGQGGPGQLYWDVPGAPLREPVKDVDAPGKPLRGLNWNFKVLRIKKVPTSVLDLSDKINSHAVVSPTLGLTFPPYTLLFKPPQLTRTITNRGFGDWSLNYGFSYRRQTWEKFWRPGYATPQFIYTSDGIQYKPFEYGDFRVLASTIPPDALPPLP